MVTVEKDIINSNLFFIGSRFSRVAQSTTEKNGVRKKCSCKEEKCISHLSVLLTPHHPLCRRAEQERDPHCPVRLSQLQARPSGKCSLCRKAEQEGHPAAAPSVCTSEQTWRPTPTPSEPVRDPACTRKHLWATYQTYRNRAKKYSSGWSATLSLLSIFHATCRLPRCVPKVPPLALPFSSLFCFWMPHVNWDRSINFHEATMFCANRGSHSSALPIQTCIFYIYSLLFKYFL